MQRTGISHFQEAANIKLRDTRTINHTIQVLGPAIPYQESNNLTHYNKENGFVYTLKHCVDEVSLIESYLMSHIL